MSAARLHRTGHPHGARRRDAAEDERAAYEVWLAANPDMKARAARFAADLALLRDAVAGVHKEPVPERLIGCGRHGDSRGRRARMRCRLVAGAAAAVIFAAGVAGGYLVGAVAAAADEGAEANEALADDAIGAYVTYAADQSHAVEVGGRPTGAIWKAGCRSGPD